MNYKCIKNRNRTRICSFKRLKCCPLWGNVQLSALGLALTACSHSRYILSSSKSRACIREDIYKRSENEFKIRNMIKKKIQNHNYSDSRLFINIFYHPFLTITTNTQILNTFRRFINEPNNKKRNRSI